MIRSIEHVAIAARDTAALARWYCDTLGFRVIVEGKGPQGTWFVGPESGAVLEIVPAKPLPASAYEQDDPGFRHLAFLVDDFDATCAALQAKGVVFDGDVIGAPGDKQLIFFADPEGNLLQLAWRRHPIGT